MSPMQRGSDNYDFCNTSQSRVTLLMRPPRREAAAPPPWWFAASPCHARCRRVAKVKAIVVAAHHDETAPSKVFIFHYRCCKRRTYHCHAPWESHKILTPMKHGHDNYDFCNTSGARMSLSLLHQHAESQNPKSRIQNLNSV